MPSMKAIKRRITSVNSTQQIMKAMNLVAASKLQRAKAQLNSVRPLYIGMLELMESFDSNSDAAEHIFFRKREAKNIAYLVVTGDRGLCGGYNLNMGKEAMALIGSKAGTREHIVVVGAKGNDYFRRRGKNVIRRFTTMADSASVEDAEQIAKLLTGLFVSGEVDEVHIAYTHFETILSHEPRTRKLLPLGGDSAVPGGEVIYDPGVQDFLDYAVPMYLSTVIYGAMVESGVCEQAARMTSMDAAARNAEEIIDDLTLVYNRKRQGAITQEITEIVSGANAIQ
ncbi:MAG: ATP synthase F1 subunit gamma [Oscillospiraceae bacterium]|nr:ATP synthase F1 subunit gamma [Oscillospiraceae bacterium]